MLSVTNIKRGSYEVGDQYRTEDRNRFHQYRLGNRFILFLSALLVLTQTLNVIDKYRLAFLAFIFFGLTGMYLSLRLEQKIKLNLKEDLSGFVIDLGENKEVISLRVRKWLANSVNTHVEHEVRFNQAIGFQAILEDNGLVVVEIIVDPEFPGTKIFRSYDLHAIAELVVLFQKVFPELDKWFYKTTTGEVWHSEHKEEFDEEMLIAKVPWEFHDFFAN
ncbi:MAG: hypothetical protein ACXADH_02260 [Candidatus Kariarchaeaceae archaeon]